MSDTKPNLGAAYALRTPEDSKQLYAAWADTYDQEFAADSDYVLHLHVARTFARLGGRGPVLDVGAGTGLCAQALAEEAIDLIDGTDISPEMLNTAATKGVYRKLFTGDILAGLDARSDSYAGVVSSGTFTTGHVGPAALDEVLRITMPSGLIVLSINARHFEAEGFKAKLEQMGDKIAEFDLSTVRIYGDAATGSHKDDLALIASLRKA